MVFLSTIVDTGRSCTTVVGQCMSTAYIPVLFARIYVRMSLFSKFTFWHWINSLVVNVLDTYEHCLNIASLMTVEDTIHTQV